MHKDKDFLFHQFVEERKPASAIAKMCGVKDSAVEYYLTKYGLYGLRGRRKFVFNESKLKLVPQVYYFLGLMCTDGYIDLKNKRVSIRLRNEGAKEVLTTLKEYFEFTGELYFYKGKDYDLMLTGEPIINFLKEVGLINCDNSDKPIPNIFPDEDCVRLFLRGCLDGDGNIHILKNKNGGYYSGTFRIVKGYKEFIEGVQSLLLDYVGVDCPITWHRTSKGTYPKLELRVADSKKFYRWVYKGFPEYRLVSKFLKAKHIVDDIV